MTLQLIYQKDYSDCCVENRLQVAMVEAGTSQNAITVIQCRDNDALGQSVHSGWNLDTF